MKIRSNYCAALLALAPRLQWPQDAQAQYWVYKGSYLFAAFILMFTSKSGVRSPRCQRAKSLMLA